MWKGVLVRRPALEKIEKHFNMPFPNVINDLHWKKGLSIKRLSSECGVSRDTFDKNAKRLNLKLRKHRDSIILDIPNRAGKNHWAYGKRKDNSEWCRMHSDRMKKDNPCSNGDILRKKQESTAIIYRNNMLPQEKAFAQILDKYSVKHEAQYVIDSYIIDFFIPSLNLCLEIDSTDKWGKERRKAAQKKDLFLSKKGYLILRINKRHLKDKDHILNVLKTNNVIGHN